MTRFRHAALTLGFVLAVAAPTRADDEADARKIIEKAVKAHGGQEKLDKLPASTVKFKGTFYGTGEGMDETATVTGVEIGTVKARLYRARQALRRRLAPLLAGCVERSL